MDVRKHTEDARLADFLDRMVHDMREPLRSIGVYAEILKEIGGQQFGEEGALALTEIPAGAARIGTLLEGLSAYAVALREPGESDSAASLQSAFTIALGELDDRIRACDATVTASGLPKAPVRISVNLDRLVQLMRIAIGNALRFRTEDAPVIRVSAVIEEPGMWTIRVEDNGIGIAKEYCEEVFRPFIRAEGRKYGGVGLGLTIAKQIVEAYGGSIRLEPAPVRGAVCVVTLPEG